MQYSEPFTLVSSGGYGSSKIYNFKSKERDLEFSLHAGSDNEYIMATYYNYQDYWQAVKDYYSKDLQIALDNCPLETTEEGYFIIYSDEDFVTLSETLEECNIIISDQFNYTPEYKDELDRRLYATYYWVFYPENKFDSYFSYNLNGKDTAEEIYEKIIQSKEYNK